MKMVRRVYPHLFFQLSQASGQNELLWFSYHVVRFREGHSKGFLLRSALSGLDPAPKPLSLLIVLDLGVNHVFCGAIFYFMTLPTAEFADDD